MPDDDYEMLPTDKREADLSEIKDLLDGIEKLPLGIDFTAWKIARITKILKIMNGIE